MYLDYNLDIEKKSVWKIAHPAQGAAPFPFTVNEAGIFYAKPGYFTQRAEKNDYLLVFTAAGTGELSYLGRTWQLGEGCACLIDCNRPHSYRTAPGEQSSWAFYWVHIAGPFVRHYYELLYEKSYLVLEAGMDTELIDCFLRMLGLIDYATAASACLLSQCAGTLLTKLVSLGGVSGNPAQDEIIPHAVEHLKQHFDQPIDLPALAARFGLSKFYFIKRFSKQVGVTPYHYLVMYRVIKAKQMLRTTDHRVGDIGRAVGFADESNFCRTFSRLTGMPPSAYRRTD